MPLSIIRLASSTDAPGILAVYRPYIENTVITFEETVPSREAFTERVEGILAQFPYLVCARDEDILGYAYAGPYRGRAAYRWDTELSIYLSPTVHGKGLGGILYGALLDLVTLQGYYNAYGCITYPNEKSRAMHLRLGFQECGFFHSAGYKAGRWWDVFWMEKRLQQAGDPPADPLPFPLLPEASIRNVLQCANARWTACHGPASSV